MSEAHQPVLKAVWPPRKKDEDPLFISIPEWSRRVGISSDSGYKAARLGQIPGCFAIGRLYRVNWAVFVQRAGDPNVAEGSQTDRR